MKKEKRIWGILFIIFIVLVLYLSRQNDSALLKVFQGSTFEPEGTWTTEDIQGEPEVKYEYQLPEYSESEEILLLLRTHWTFYEIQADGEEIYHTTGERNGATHLFTVPSGTEITLTCKIKFHPFVEFNPAKNSNFKGGI